MSERIYTMADSTFWISQSPVPAKIDSKATDFAGVSWVQVKGLYNVGEIGGEQTINEFEPLDSDWMLKAKGTRNGGTMTNQFIPLALDPGQQKFLEAIEEKCNPYAFKLERGAGCEPTSAVTITIADPGVVTWVAHGFEVGQPIVFTTTGTLPTGLTPGTVYYVVSTPSDDTFTVAATVGGAPIETTGAAGTGHTATAPAAGMTQMFQGFATDGAMSGGGKNDPYLRSWSVAINGPVITI